MRGVGSRAPIPLITIGILAVASLVASCGGEAREADVAAEALTSTTLASVETRTSLDVEDGDDFTAGDDGESSGPAVSLVDTLWILVSGLEVVDGYEPSLLFGSGGHDGGNGFGADYDVSGTSLTITMRYITTVGCSGDRAAVAEAFQGAIAVADSYEVSGDQLMLRGPTVELVFEAPPAIDFGQVVDVIWLLDELVHEGERLLVEGSVGFIELRSDGTFVGSTGCRELSGRWQGAAANVVGFADLAAEGTCRPSLVDQDGFVIGVLEGGTDLTFDGEQLRAGALGNRSLVFRRAQPEEAPHQISTSDQIGLDHDPAVTWAVGGLDGMGDVEGWAGRGAGGPVVAEVGAGERLVAAGTQIADVDGEIWRRIHTDAFAEGWILDRYLVQLG